VIPCRWDPVGTNETTVEKRGFVVVEEIDDVIDEVLRRRRMMMMVGQWGLHGKYNDGSVDVEYLSWTL
jgi:hypothetical protein